MARSRKKSNNASMLAVVLIAGIWLVFSYPYIFGSIAGLVLIVWLLLWWGEHHQELPTYNIADIDEMEGGDFERYVAELFARLGYNTEVTKGSRDFGVDVVARKNGDRIAIQVKRYSQKVNLKAVQQAVAGMHRYDCNKSMVVTNNYFAPSAIELADHSSCELVDRDELIKLILMAEKNEELCKHHANTSGKENDPPAVIHVIVKCNICDQQLRLPAGNQGLVSCPRCKGDFFAST